MCVCVMMKSVREAFFDDDDERERERARECGGLIF